MPPLTADDLEVLAAALNFEIVDHYAPYVRADTKVDPAPFVSPDRTIRARDPPQRGGLHYDCMETKDLSVVDGLLRELFGTTAQRLFHKRNRESRVIDGTVRGAQILPAKEFVVLVQGRWGKEFFERFPNKRGIVMFSAPIYPVPSEAIVYILRLVSHANFIHLAYDGDSWKVRRVERICIS